MHGNVLIGAPLMAHVAFISYSKDDKGTVEAICKTLEENGLDCCYTPRNVAVGADWDASIMEALSRQPGNDSGLVITL